MFLPEKSHGQRSLAGYTLWGGKRVRHDLATKQQQQQHSKRIPGSFLIIKVKNFWDLGLRQKRWFVIATDFADRN